MSQACIHRSLNSLSQTEFAELLLRNISINLKKVHTKVTFQNDHCGINLKIDKQLLQNRVSKYNRCVHSPIYLQLNITE